MTTKGTDEAIGRAQHARHEAHREAMRSLANGRPLPDVVRELRAAYRTAWTRHEQPVRQHEAEIKKAWDDRHRIARSGGGVA
jgi:hypothetical protein